MLGYFADATGLVVQAQRIEYPLPGVVRLVGFTAEIPPSSANASEREAPQGTDSEDRLLASAKTVEIADRGDWWEIKTHGLDVNAASATAIHNLLTQQLARLRSGGRQKGWLLHAVDASFAKVEPAFPLERFSIGISPFDDSAHVWAKLQLKGRSDVVGCRLLQRIDAAWRLFEVWTGDAEIPAALIGWVNPAWKPSGEPVLFKGHLRAVHTDEGWSVASGTSLAAEAPVRSELRFPQGRAELGVLQGDLRVAIDDFEMRGDRVQRLQGHIASKGGVLDAVRLGRIVEQMGGWTQESVRIAAEGTRVDFQRIAASITIDRGRCTLVGECPYPEPGVVVVGAGDRKLAASKRRHVSLLTLADALSPPGSVLMPVGRNQTWLQCLAPSESWMR